MKNIILSDCEKWKIKDFKQGIEEASGEKYDIEMKICIGRRNFINNLYRYLIYIFWPIKIFMKRKKYNTIVGWQQFFTIFLAFYCRIFSVKKINKIIICNFTYKAKKGIWGKIYRELMKFCINNVYVDYIHVPSFDYAKLISKDFCINVNKFIITPFGIEDMYNKWKHLKKDNNDKYNLAIGRSNRDYEFLINEWKKLPKKYKLYIISDNYKPKKALPENITLLDNVVGDKQYDYIINCNTMIIPIKDGRICSGDTVLLTAMCFEKLVIITSPSTLEEMYIVNNENGIAIKKDEKTFSVEMLKILCDKENISKIGQQARESFLKNFSRKSMGTKIGEIIRNENSNDRS